MNKEFEAYSEQIHGQFIKPFDSIFKSKSKSQRKKLAPCLSNLYRRWFYSAILENTVLTPANLFESLNRHYGHPAGTSPNVHMRTPVNYTGLSFSYADYSRSDHPVISDFLTIIDYCRPAIDLTELDQMPDELAAEAARDLSMNDPFYASYLLSIALEMGFLVKIPSIHANRAQLVRGIDKRLSISDDKLFDKIVSCSLRYASRSLSEIVPLPVPLFDEEYLLNILKEPVETDVIFQRLYDTIGVDLEELIDLDIFEELDMLDMAVISGTYLLGIVLDKFFLTPFGHYLKLIRPVYMLPFDLENEISIYLESYMEEDELGIAFYAPCSRYFMTDMGLEYFKVEPNADNYIDIKEKLNFADIRGLFGEGPAEEIESITKAFESDSRIYTFKIKYMNEPKMWLNMEASDSTSLHRMYLELAYYFDIDKNGEYSFFPDETENPFAAYASPNQPRRAKKAANTVLADLDLEEKQVMFLSLSIARPGTTRYKERWSFELTKVQQGRPGQTYPIVTRVGKALKDFFEWS